MYVRIIVFVLIILVFDLNFTKGQNFNCDKAGVFPKYGVCNKFYRCVPKYSLGNIKLGLKKCLFRCGHGYGYDVELGKCLPSSVAITTKNCVYHLKTDEAESTKRDEIPSEQISKLEQHQSDSYKLPIYYKTNYNSKQDHKEETQNKEPSSYSNAYESFKHVNETHCIYDLTLSYIFGSPDGVLKRMIGFNGQFPGPTLTCTRGQIMIVRVTNLIEDATEPTSIHWHGIEQYLTPFYDGPEYVTQCPIIRNTSMIYTFQLLQSGTYWYHSHHSYQYVDGAWGFLIVHNSPREVYQDLYDEEATISVNDWYHTPARRLAEIYLSNDTFPSTDASLINGRGSVPCANVTSSLICNPKLQKPALIKVQRGKTYRFRILNSSAATNYNFTINGHKMVVIETDGVDTILSDPVDVVMLLPAQRYSVLVIMDKPLNEYWIRIVGFAVPGTGLTGEAVLQYSPSSSVSSLSAPSKSRIPRYTPYNKQTQYKSYIPQGRPRWQNISWDYIASHGGITPTPLKDLQDCFTSKPNTTGLNDFQKRLDIEHAMTMENVQLPTTTALNASEATLLEQMTVPPYTTEDSRLSQLKYDQLVVINMTECILPNTTGARLCINGRPFVPGSTTSTPVLFQMTLGQPIDTNARPLFLPQLQKVIRVVVNNQFPRVHPWHLHGHTFDVNGEGEPNEGDFDPARDERKLTAQGVRRDTTYSKANSWLVFTFITNNPGTWFFHCHINWHLEAGLGATFIEGQSIAQRLYRIPPIQSVRACQRVGVNII